jgi:hypothetical protein
MKSFGDEFELGLEVRTTDICLIEGIRNCRRSEIAIVTLGDSILEVILFWSSTLKDGRLS